MSTKQWVHPPIRSKWQNTKPQINSSGKECSLTSKKETKVKERRSKCRSKTKVNGLQKFSCKSMIGEKEKGLAW